MEEAAAAATKGKKKKNPTQICRLQKKGVSRADAKRTLPDKTPSLPWRNGALSRARTRADACAPPMTTEY